MWYASTKGSEKDEWVPGRVVANHLFYVEARKLKNGSESKGPTMKPAYEHIRLEPHPNFAVSLMGPEMEHEGEIDSDDFAHIATLGVMISSNRSGDDSSKKRHWFG